MRRSVAVAIALAATATIAATVLVPTEFREIVADAALILRGHVTDLRAIESTDHRVETVATVAVDSVLKGQSDAFVSIRVPGGQIGSTRTTVVGSPQLRIGEEALFLLKRGPDNALRPIGLSMGVYPVRIEQLTRQRVVDPPIVAGRTATAGQRVVHGDTRRQAMPVRDFEALVQLIVATRTSGISANRR